MKIAFIRPSMMGKPTKDSMMPLVFAIIKAYTPVDVEIAFYDERKSALPENIDADAVAFTVETFTAKRAYILAEKFRLEGKKVVMGGFHPTMLPDESLRHCDAVVIGEAEDTWEKLVNDLKHNTLKEKYISRNDTDLSEAKADYSVFDNNKYSGGLGLVQSSRGCKFNCDFCSVHAFFGDSIRTKPTSKILDDIKKTKQKYLFFVDDNLFSDEATAKELFNALIPLKKKWFCQVSIDIASNKELLTLMRKSGCLLVIIGFESLDVNNLRLMGKGENIKNIDYSGVVKNVYDAGLMIYGSFVHGYAFDDIKSMKQSYDFALDNNFAIANFNPLMPMPGTRLFKRAEAENTLTYEKWWLADEFRYGDSMIIPERITPETLTETCKSSRYNFNAYKNILKRLFGAKANIKNLPVYLLINLISRKEIYGKQGGALGGTGCERDINQA